jgi:methylenetetrahydrofolate reductase (NADPH)
MRTIVDRSLAIGTDWRASVDELNWPVPDEFYLLPQGTDGLPDAEGEYCAGTVDGKLRWDQRLFLAMNRVLVDDASPVSRFLRARLGVTPERLEDESWRRGLWYRIMGLSRMKKNFLGCVDCGDCIQDYLSYSGCSMGKCFKESRNGPCGGSRPGGGCEVEPDQKCVWYEAYLSTLAAGKDVQRFAHTFIPPRDWSLDRKDSLANRIAGIDNYSKRRTVDARAAHPPAKK